jgi:hypothetical protein
MGRVADVAVAHEAVVEHFAGRRQATVVPMQLFTMFSTLDRAIEETKSQRSALEPVLAHIAGCEEWGVRINRGPAAAGARTRAPTRAKSGAAFLAARKQARDEARAALRGAAETADHAYHALAVIARDARRRDDAPSGAVPPPLLDAAFLVPAARRARFKAAARRLAATAALTGADVTLTGPWPAYNFVQTGSPE